MSLIKVVGQGGVLPSQAYDDDAGYDLTCSDSVLIKPHNTATLPTGLAVELPNGCWGLIVGRSSAWARGLLVKTSVIDPGWRGQLFVDVMNMTPFDVKIEAGERVGQLIPMINVAPTTTIGWVSELGPGSRGTNGYGSSGR